MTSAAQDLAEEFIRGVTRPRLWVVPPRDSDMAGHEACRFYRKMTGREILPWEELAVVEILAERRLPDGRWKWAANDVGLIVARQNGKGDVLLIIELYFLFVVKARRIFHSAQLAKTSTDAFKRMSAVIKSSPKLLAQLDRGVRGIRSGKGAEEIVTADQRVITFFTRSDNAGRGLYGDLLICDEAYDMTANELAALSPLIKTSPYQLTIYASTPVDEEAMLHGEELARIRKNALTGGPFMAWLEWSVPPRQVDPETGRFVHLRDERLDDPHYYAMANPSMNWPIGRDGDGYPLYVLELDAIRADRNRMGTRKFMVEDLCVEDYWPDPDLEEQEDVPIDPAAAERAARRDQALLHPVALGIDRSPDGKTSLTAAGWQADGTWRSETIYHRAGIDWLVPALVGGPGFPVGIVDLFHPAVLVVDAAGPAGAIVAKLLAAKLEPVVTGVAEMGRAAIALVDDFEEGHYVPTEGDSPFFAAVEIARWRDLGESKAFARKGFGDISPLVAAALAGYGLHLAVAFSKPKRALTPEALPPPVEEGAHWAGGDPVDLATVGF